MRIFARVFPTDYFACSEKAGIWLFGNKNFKNGNVNVIKNAVDFKRFKVSDMFLEDMRNTWELKNKFVIGHVGRFTFAKNHKFIIELFKQISDLRDDAVLMLVGDGEMNGEIHNWVEEKKLDDKVIFVGQVENPQIYYQLSDVMIVPSIFEGLSLATIESQIAGVPVVVSDAIPEEAIISNGVKRLSLSDNNWVDEIIKMADEHVVLNEKARNITLIMQQKIRTMVYRQD